jgi:integrase/recombinase XerD
MIVKLNSMDDLLFKKLSEWIVWKIVNYYSKKYLKRDIRTHEIRHARATQLEEDGASIKDIQRYLGHSSLTTTEIYLHSSESKSLEKIKEVSGILR